MMVLRDCHGYMETAMAALGRPWWELCGLHCMLFLLGMGGQLGEIGNDSRLIPLLGQQGDESSDSVSAPCLELVRLMVWPEALWY